MGKIKNNSRFSQIYWFLLKKIACSFLFYTEEKTDVDKLVEINIYMCMYISTPF